MATATKRRRRANKKAGVLYGRMSSAKQDASPAVQKAEANKLAREYGRTITATYFDESVSGNTLEKRPGLLDLLDAAERGEFDTVFVAMSDRLSRLDAHNSIALLSRLENRGVRVISGDDGVIEIGSTFGVVKHAMQQDGHAAELRKISQRTTNGKRSKVEAKIENNRPPYGYVREYRDAAGSLLYRTKSGERFQAPSKTWIMHLVEDTAGPADVVRQIFARCLEGVGSTTIARELNDEGIPSSLGRKWSDVMVRETLKNRRYTGALVHCRQVMGRHNTVAGVAPPSENKLDAPLTKIDNPEGPKVTENNHPALVSRADFEAAQAIMRSRQNRKKATGSVVADDSPYILTGFLRCGHCGGTMSGHKGYYRCATAAGNPGACPGYRKKADLIEQPVLEAVAEALGLPRMSDGIFKIGRAGRAKIDQETADQLAAAGVWKEDPGRIRAAGRKEDPRERRRRALAKKVADLGAKVQKWGARILDEDDDDLAASMRAAFNEKKAERDQAQAELDELILEAEADTDEGREAAQKAAGLLLNRLGKAKTAAELRLVLAAVVDVIQIDFVRPKKKHARAKLTGATLIFKGGEATSLLRETFWLSSGEVSISFSPQIDDESPRISREKAPSSPRRRPR